VEVFDEHGGGSRRSGIDLKYPVHKRGGDDVVGIRSINDHGVRGCVSGAPTDGGGQVDADIFQVRPAQVVHGDGFGGAKGVETDCLDIAQVHDDAADVARKSHATAVW